MRFSRRSVGTTSPYFSVCTIRAEKSPFATRAQTDSISDMAAGHRVAFFPNNNMPTSQRKNVFVVTLPALLQQLLEPGYAFANGLAGIACRSLDIQQITVDGLDRLHGRPLRHATVRVIAVRLTIGAVTRRDMG